MANILRSLVPIRKVVNDSMSQQPQIHTDFTAVGEPEMYVDELESYLSKLTTQRDRFTEFYKLLLNASSTDENTQKEIDDQTGQDAATLMEIDSVVTKYSTEIKRVTRKRTMSASASSDSLLSSNYGPPAVKLPKLQLPMFDGNVMKWAEFWDSFESSVHKSHLSDVEKINYLKGQLTGPAKEATIGLLASTAGNYQRAVEALRKQFGNSHVIISTHCSAMNSLAPLVHYHNGKLRQLFNEIEQRVNSLIALGEQVNNSQMASLIKSKFPIEVVIHLDERFGVEMNSVEKLRESMHNYLSIRESAELGRNLSAHSSLCKPKFPKDSDTVSARLQGTASALLTSSPSSRYSCAFCDGQHYSSECPKYATVTERVAQLGGRCLICLSSKHRISACTVVKKCYFCRQSGMHHSSLCPDKFGCSKNGKVDAKSSKGSNSAAFLAAGESSVLQTATVKVQSSDGKKEMDVRLVLDSGSSRSYISKALAKNLKLQPISFDQLCISTFSLMAPKHIDSEHVKLKMKLLDGSYMDIEANVIPTIARSVTRPGVDVAKYQHLLNGLPLADELSTEAVDFEPDFLLGTDYFWDIIGGGHLTLDDNLFLIGSKIGWLLGGRRSDNYKLSPALTASNTLMVCASGVTMLSSDDN